MEKIHEIMLIMGTVDNAVLGLAFYCTYLNIEKLIEKGLISIALSKFHIGIISALTANTFSDGMGFAIQNEWMLCWYVMLGCLIGAGIVPIVEGIKLLINKIETIKAA